MPKPKDDKDKKDKKPGKEGGIQENLLESQVKSTEIVDIMKDSYIDYAMSVIVARALPDVRDGLKPAQRRILYTMLEDGLRHNAKYRKSATVVGSTLGRYHPHGDTAVYDTMVRLAQDFTLRYPLVQGQGNFGCFTKDTKVKLADGRDLAFCDLVKEHQLKKKNYTYTVNGLGRIAIAEIKNPRLTKRNAELVKVTLDNGAQIECTPNHLFMTKSGSYKEARDLAENESLMPLYQRISEKTDRINRGGYVLIYQPKTDEWVPAHNLADNYNLSAKKYGKSAGRVRHHADFNKLNNNPDNIARMQWGQHWKIHYSHASLQHQNPEYCQKIAQGRKEFWSNPANRGRYSIAAAKRNESNWKDPVYREKMAKILSEVNKKYVQEHPEKRRELSLRATETLKRMWQKPEYKALMREKIVKANKNRITNLTGKLKFVTVCKQALKDFSVIDEGNYSQTRQKIYPYGSAPLWETGVQKYFQNNPELILQEINGNHKVVRVEKISRKEDVYDLTIEKTHNFALAAGVFVHNSIDGDPAAAQRYTECRLSKVGEETLRDIEKNTVNFADNYDGTRKEPMVLPSPVPQLLLNGSLGIAVGMATNIPPHNLGEVCDALTHLLDNPKAATEDLFQFIKGPDFPLGGEIYDRKSIIQVYSQGKGPIFTRGKADIVHVQKTDRYQIIITEIPYQIQKSSLLEQIARLVQEKKIDGIKDVRDESDKDGMRVVIDLHRDGHPQKVLNRLYKFTDLQRTFHLNMLALVDGIQPEVLNLADVLNYFLAHRREVVTRRIQYELDKAKERAHILEGLVKCLADIDEVIRIIRRSENRDEARTNLMKRFKLDEIQANAILETKLAALAKLERQKIEDELKQLKTLIDEWTSTLKSPAKIKSVMKKELAEVKLNFGDDRRTKVVAGKIGEISEEDLIPEEETIITLTNSGYIKRIDPKTYKIQKRGGKGIIGLKTVGDDIVEQSLIANTHDRILFFTDSGRVFQNLAYEIPEGARVAKGRALVNFLEISPQEKVLYMMTLGKIDSDKAKAKIKAEENLANEKYLLIVTKNGIAKKTALDEFDNIRRSGLIAITLKKGDLLRKVFKTSGQDEILIITKKGQSIRFKESQVRPMGRQAAGIKGISLKRGDEVVGMDVISLKETAAAAGQKPKEKLILVVMENGYGKKTSFKEYRLQNRGGSGIKAAQITSKTGDLVTSCVLTDEEELMVISKKGQVIRIPIDGISKLSRPTQGVRIMRMDEGDKVAAASCI